MHVICVLKLVIFTTWILKWKETNFFLIILNIDSNQITILKKESKFNLMNQDIK